MGTTLAGRRVLVTGAGGFIGSRLVTALLDAGACVTAVVDPSQAQTRIEPLLGRPGLNLVVCSLVRVGDLATLKRAAHEAELVAHLWVHIPSAIDFWDCAVEEVNTNLLGAFNLLKATGPSLQGVCFASSILVYGHQSRVPVTEEAVPHPPTSYAATKLALEAYLVAFSRARQIPVTMLRYATVYGPGETGHRAIPNFIAAVAQGQPPVIHGDGSETRDYVYLDDVVKATLRALERKPSRILNIGSGRGHSTLEVAQDVMRLCGNRLEPRFTTRSEPNMDLVCDISAATQALGYRPETELSQGLVQEIQWYERHILGRPVGLSAVRGA